MIERLLKYKVKIRTIVFLLLAVVAYAFTVFYLFGNHDLFGSIVCIFFLYIFLHFVYIDIQDLVKKRYLLLILIGLVIVDVLFMLIFSWKINIWLIVSVFMLNMTLFVLFIALDVLSFR